MPTGIELVLSKAPGDAVQFVLLDEVSTLKWASRKHVELWQAVALHSSVDPDALGGQWKEVRYFYQSREAFEVLMAQFDTEPQPKGTPGPDDLLGSNFTRAGKAAAGEDLPCLRLAARDVMTSEVSLAEFLGWALSSRLPVVSGFRARTEPSIGGPWPWGRHTTPKLELLAAIGERWRLVADHGSYDPDDIRSAPHSGDVVAWLMEQGVGESVAKVMASMLRPPTLRTGPR